MTVPDQANARDSGAALGTAGSSRSSFAEAVVTLRAQLTRIPAEHRDEWLRMLYANHNLRYSNDGDRIWVTGAVMIPLSLGCFIALTQDKQVSLPHLLLLAVVSLALIVVWLIVAETHRRLQQESKAWLKAIESVLGMDDLDPLKIEERSQRELVPFAKIVKYMTWGLLAIEVVSWLAVLLYWPRA
jgi:hypothetical protein